MNLIYLYQDVVAWNNFVGNVLNKEGLQELYINLVKEETTEIFDSIKTNDAVEFLDGVCDTLVVGSFLLAVKNQKDFKDYDLSFKEVNIEPSINYLKDLINEDVFKNIEKVLSLVENIGYSSGLNIELAFKEVMESNWSKFPLVDNVNPLDEVKYIENQGRYTNVRFERNIDLNGNERYIFKDGNGKVVKPSTFKEPKLANFIPESFKIFK
tara:strand:+ start:7322 stop:7954 length:633 start_codon:yes stop_codon:yes gene_type:complete